MKVNRWYQLAVDEKWTPENVEFDLKTYKKLYKQSKIEKNLKRFHGKHIGNILIRIKKSLYTKLIF